MHNYQLNIAYTLVITSCGRHDLLDLTLNSFIAFADVKPTEIIIIEDSKTAYIASARFTDYARMTLLQNEKRLGQIASIDRAYKHVKTPYIFHCEDDWQFERSGFITESFEILKQFPQASMVGLRPRHEQNPLVRDIKPSHSRSGVVYYPLDPSRHPEYFSYCFNPGLRRLCDYQKFAPFASIGHESDISYAFKAKGYAIYNLEKSAVHHIGDGRHINDPFLHTRPVYFWQKWQNSLRKRIKRLKRRIRLAKP